jgi:hypothetical protein
LTQANAKKVWRFPAKWPIVSASLAAEVAQDFRNCSAAETLGEFRYDSVVISQVELSESLTVVRVFSPHGIDLLADIVNNRSGR